jgi:hypothetical protein
LASCVQSQLVRSYRHDRTSGNVELAFQRSDERTNGRLVAWARSFITQPIGSGITVEQRIAQSRGGEVSSHRQTLADHLAAVATCMAGGIDGNPRGEFSPCAAQRLRDCACRPLSALASRAKHSPQLPVGDSTASIRWCRRSWSARYLAIPSDERIGRGDEGSSRRRRTCGARVSSPTTEARVHGAESCVVGRLNWPVALRGARSSLRIALTRL